MLSNDHDDDSMILKSSVHNRSQVNVCHLYTACFIISFITQLHLSMYPIIVILLCVFKLFVKLVITIIVLLGKKGKTDRKEGFPFCRTIAKLENFSFSHEVPQAIFFFSLSKKENFSWEYFLAWFSTNLLSSSTLIKPFPLYSRCMITSANPSVKKKKHEQKTLLEGQWDWKTLNILLSFFVVDEEVWSALFDLRVYPSKRKRNLYPKLLIRNSFMSCNFETLLLILQSRLQQPLNTLSKGIQCVVHCMLCIRSQCIALFCKITFITARGVVLSLRTLSLEGHWERNHSDGLGKYMFFWYFRSICWIDLEWKIGRDVYS